MVAINFVTETLLAIHWKKIGVVVAVVGVVVVVETVVVLVLVVI